MSVYKHRHMHRYAVLLYHRIKVLTLLTPDENNSFGIILVLQTGIVIDLLCVRLSSLKHFLQRLEQLNQYPDFNNYLIFVLTKLKSEGEWPVSTVRLQACHFCVGAQCHDSADPMASLPLMMWLQEYGSL